MSAWHQPRTLAAALALAATFSVHAAESAKFPVEGHVRNPSVARAEAPSTPLEAGGTFYLTGTSNINTLDPRYADFQNNDGVRLWKSSDLKTWEDAGLAWNLAGDASAKLYGNGIIMRHMRPDRDQTCDETWQHGVTDVSLLRIGGDWFVVCSMNNYGVCILRSEKGPAGPYKQVFELSRSLFPQHGRLFVDQDNAVYLVWADGLIARLSEDLSALAEEPRALRFATKKGGTTALPAGASHVALARYGDRYIAVFLGWEAVDGKGRRAIFASSSASLDQPFSTPARLADSASRPDLFVSDSGELSLVTSDQAGPQIWPIVFKDEIPQLANPTR